MRILQQICALSFLLNVACMVSCGQDRDVLPASESALLSVRDDSIRAVLRASSDVVRLEKDLFLSLETVAPAEFDLLIPSATGFVAGFEVKGEFDELPVKSNGMITRRRRMHLVPQISAACSVGPIPIEFVDYSRNPAVSGTVDIAKVSIPVVLPVSPVPEDIVVVFNPVSPVVPLSRILLRMAPVPMGLFFVILLGLYVRRRMFRSVEPLSSREAALQELRKLMECDLLAGGRVEEFYRSLTQIVRCYIEQTHSIMAPEQTTEELLASVAADERFDRQFSAILARFLREADFVKFASGSPEPEDVTAEIDLAKRIIEKEE